MDRKIFPEIETWHPSCNGCDPYLSISAKLLFKCSQVAFISPFASFQDKRPTSNKKAKGRGRNNFPICTSHLQANLLILRKFFFFVFDFLDCEGYYFGTEKSLSCFYYILIRIKLKVVLRVVAGAKRPATTLRITRPLVTTALGLSLPCYQRVGVYAIVMRLFLSN